MATKKPLVLSTDGSASVLQVGDYLSPTALGSGSPGASNFLRGDGTWQDMAASPDAAIVRVSLTGDQAGIADATWTKVILNNISFDTTGGYYSTTTGRFQPTVAGYYNLSACAHITGSGIVTASVGFYYGTGGLVAGDQMSGSSLAVRCSVTDVHYFNGTTDYAELDVYGDCSSGTITINGYSGTATHFHAFLINGNTGGGGGGVVPDLRTLGGVALSGDTANITMLGPTSSPPQAGDPLYDLVKLLFTFDKTAVEARNNVSTLVGCTFTQTNTGHHLNLDTGGYVYVADAPSLRIATADFCVESVLATTYSSTTLVMPILCQYDNTGSAGSWIFGIKSGKLIFFDGSTPYAGNTAVNDGVVHELSMRRVGTVCTFFIDGVADGSFTCATSLGLAYNVQIGRYGTSAIPSVGVFQTIRFTVGSGRLPTIYYPTRTYYPAYLPENIVSPGYTTTGDRLRSNVTLHVPMYGPSQAVGIQDLVTRAFVKSSSSFTSSTVDKYGTVYGFDGSTTYLSAPGFWNLYMWWDTEFMIEMNINIVTHRATPQGRPLQIGIQSLTADSCYWSFGTNSAGRVCFYYWNGSVNTITANTVLSLNTNYDIAVVKSGSMVYLLVNGVVDGSAAIVGTPQIGTELPITIGCAHGTYFQGKMWDIRITKGARRTTIPYVPATTPFDTAPFRETNPTWAPLDYVDSGTVFTVPTKYQHVLADSLYVDGSLEINGKVIFV